MKYTKERLEEAAKNSLSNRDVMRYLGANLASSSTATHIGRLLRRFEIDTSHFTGQGWSAGKAAHNRRAVDQILVLRSEDQPKESTQRLRWAMIEANIPQQCACGITDRWQDKLLQLEMDHINGNCRDNRRENLRFICPNCHSQLDTNGRKGR